MTALTLNQAAQGMILYKTAIGLSPRTIRNYRTSFDKLTAHIPADTPIADIDRRQLVEFFHWLQTEYRSEPDGVAPRGSIKLSPKSVRNVHTDLSALWSWAVDEGWVETNIVRTIEAPNASPPVVEPYTQEEVEALLHACDSPPSWKASRAQHRTADRDRSIIMLLLDTGLRASELCNIATTDVNMVGNSIRVLGKGRKERLVYFGRRTAKALWRYITPRLGLDVPENRLFTVGPDDDLRPLERRILGQQLARIGERAGVKNVYPHRFRHTFAITYLRNGGDLFTLQALLGHSDLAMVRRYAQIAQNDCATAYRTASPVDKWRL